MKKNTRATKLVAQGDVMFERVKAVPADATEEAPRDGMIVVAHSETGHHHAIRAEEALGIRHYRTADPLIGYLDVPHGAEVVHLRNFDTHAPARLAPGKWKVRRQREAAPEGWRRAAD